MMLLEKFNIKTFEREDKENIKLFAELINKEDNLEISISDKVLEYVLSQSYLRENIILAYYDGILAGFVGCTKNSETSREGNLELIIHPCFRNQGLGKALYDLAISKAMECGINKLTASARENMEYAVKFLDTRAFKVQKYMWKMDYSIQDLADEPLPEGEYSIRQLNNEDIGKYVEIMNAGFKKEGDVMYNENSFRTLLINPDEYVFFIENEGKAVATAAIGLQRDIHRGYIHNVTVFKDCRGKGYGRIALLHCLNRIKAEGLSKAALNVDGSNKSALNLYKSVGFVETDTDIFYVREL